MPLLLTQADLRPLVASDHQLLRALDRLERALLHQKDDPPDRGQGIDVEIDLEESRVQRVQITPLPDAITLRWHADLVDSSVSRNASMLLLFDPRSGALLSLMAADDLIHLRTPLPAGVGLRRLARPEARAVGVLGIHPSAAWHLRVCHAAVPQLEEVCVSEKTAAADPGLRESARRLGMAYRTVEDEREVVEGADVVVGLDPESYAAFNRASPRPGALVVQLHPGPGASAPVPSVRRIVPVRRPETNRESAVADADLADVLAGLVPAREDPNQIVWWDTSPPRPWDPPIANWAYKWALEHRVGTEFDLTRTG